VSTETILIDAIPENINDNKPQVAKRKSMTLMTKPLLLHNY